MRKNKIYGIAVKSKATVTQKRYTTLKLEVLTTEKEGINKMLYPNFIQKIIAIFQKNTKTVKNTKNFSEKTDVKRYHRGCFVKLPGERTKFCSTQIAAAKYMSKAYGVEVQRHAISNALARSGVVYFGKSKAVLAKVSYEHDIED